MTPEIIAEAKRIKYHLGDKLTCSDGSIEVMMVPTINGRVINPLDYGKDLESAVRAKCQLFADAIKMVKQIAACDTKGEITP
jgi:hypothetical protein